MSFFRDKKEELKEITTKSEKENVKRTTKVNESISIAPTTKGTSLVPQFFLLFFLVELEFGKTMENLFEVI